jgi:dipeptidyl aminopeptidase/acylaminoacyl peptidase
MSRTSRPPAPERPRAATVRRVQEALLGLDHPVEARVSPDGRTVAVTVSGPERTDVVLVPADGSGASALTSGPASASASVAGPVPPSLAAPVQRHRPRWLPDARTLLLVTEAVPGLPGGAALPALTAWDTVTGARRTLALVPGAVEELLVSDDGTEVLLLVADDGSERDGMNLGLPVRLGPAPDPESFRPGTGRRRLLHGELPSPVVPSVPRAAAGTELRDAGPAGLTVWNCAWRGGGTAVATVSEETLPAGYYRARLALLDLCDGSARTVYEPEGQLAAPALSADGRRAAVVEGISIVAGRPVVLDLSDGATDRVTHSPTAVEDVTWLSLDPAAPDRLLVAGWCGTGSRVAEVRLGTDLPGGADVTVRWRAGAVLGGPGFQPALTLTADGSLAAGILEAPGLPPQAVVAATAGPDAWSWRPVTALNPGADATRAPVPPAAAPGLVDLSRVRTREASWTSADGRPVHGLLLDAPDVPVPGGEGDADGAGTTDGPRPLAVVVHGGPSWLWSAHHAPADVLGLAPALAAAGWLVLLPNPRGSSGYGLDHARAVVGGFGERDLDDLLTGVAALTDAGEAAPGRAAVLGHSYGGYLAAVAASRPTVFTAAVVVSAPTDWLSFAHTSVIGGGYELTYRIGDTSTGEGRAALLARSPVFADAGPAVPTLLLHGEHDRVTPVSQAQELYRSLARRGAAPVELHVYPGEGHEFTDPAHLLDAAARAEAWLERHVVRNAGRAAAPHIVRPGVRDAGDSVPAGPRRAGAASTTGETP